MQLLLPPKDTILALPQTVSKKDCKMVFLGYKSLINTGGQKKKDKPFVQTATATQTAEVMPLDNNPFQQHQLPDLFNSKIRRLNKKASFFVVLKVK